MQTGCGNNGCRTAEEQYYGGIWERTQFTTVKPINPNVIQQETGMGAYVLYNGTTEARAKENLWYELKTGSGSDVIVTSGNRFTMNATGGVMLAGTSQTLNITMKDYIGLGGGFYSSSKVIETSHTVENIEPTQITKTTIYNLDGTTTESYKYEIKDPETGYTATITELTDPPPDKCKIKSKSNEEKINYIWYYPKKIIFYKWIDSSNNIIDSVVEISEDNNLACRVESQANVLWYICTFSYDGKNLQYKRRVTPVTGTESATDDYYYAQYEEQVSVDESEIAKIMQKKATGNNLDYSPINCNENDHECIENASNQVSGQSTISDEELQQYYYFCIVAGKPTDISRYCVQYKKKIYTENETSQKSQIMVVFKTKSEIFDSTTVGQSYNNQSCFQQGEYKNRFISASSAVSSECKESLSYQQFCRMTPTSIKYRLHKIKKDGYNWLDSNASTADIGYCTLMCPKTGSYNTNDVVNECPKRCLVWKYTDNGTVSSGSSNIDEPYVVSFVDYQHKTRKENDLRSGSQYKDANNTMYYTTNKNLIQTGKLDTMVITSMTWYDVRFPCIQAVNTANDDIGYRRMYDGASTPCCADLTNKTPSIVTSTSSPDYAGGTPKYYMCADINDLNSCTPSLLTNHICNADEIAAGNCFSVKTPNLYKSKYSNDGAHAFCNGYQDDINVFNDMHFERETVYSPSKPAYLVNMEALREYMPDASAMNVPTLYPENDRNYVGLEYGLIPVAGDEIETITCEDRILPLEPFTEETYLMQKPKGYDDFSDETKNSINGMLIQDGCKISGKYYTYESENKVLFGKDVQGIIPVKWSMFPIKAGQSVPISVSTQYPILVKSGDKYIEMRNGNGLMVYLDVEDNDDAKGTTYSDPDMWQCNVGMGGSYGYYHPYDYDYTVSHNSDENPRNIVSDNNMWWWCTENPIPMWFSGYDFKNVKTGKPVYMHVYDTNELVKFLPEYSSESESVPHEELPVERVGCNEDGLPSSMVIGGKVYAHSDLFGIHYDSMLGAQYIYSNSEGGQQLIPIGDPSITSKTYEKYEPKIIVVDLADEDKENVQIQASKGKMEYNKLKRTYDKNGDDVIQAYYEFDYFSKHYKLKVEDSAIHTPAICYNEGETPAADTLSDDTISQIKSIKFEKDSKNYILNTSKDDSEIFTRFGPFSGMHINTSGLLLPAIYTTEGACLDHFIYDEQKDVTTWLTMEVGIPRENVSHSWRLELTSPEAEYNKGIPLISEESDNSTGTLSACYRTVEFESCGINDIPDIALVDLSDTINAKKKKTISGSVVLYKDENLIQRVPKDYYTVSFAPLGWVNYELAADDPIVSSITCGGYSNCADDESPVIEITANGVHYRLQDGDEAGGSPVQVGKVHQKTILSFDLITDGVGYNKGNYTMENYIADQNAICFKTNTDCKSNLVKYVGIDQQTINKISPSNPLTVETEYLYSLSRAPYFVSCHGPKAVNNHIQYKYSSPYQLTNTTVYPKMKNDTLEGGYVLKTNIYDFVSNKHFARCVPSWITPKWMIMQQPNDPSTFYGGYTALSGAYIAPDGLTWSQSSVMKDFYLDAIWKNYGGIVKNVVINQTCTPENINNIPYKSSCTIKNSTSFNASFKAKYDKQIIMVKPIVNDPINTSDDNCQIKIAGSKTASADIKMNSPFQLKKDMINGMPVDKSEIFKNVSGVQSSETINGNGKHGYEFFKLSEFQRNMIGAGIIYPSWTTMMNDNSVAIFNKDDQINFQTIGSYYASGSLSHDTHAYCTIPGTSQATSVDATFAAYVALFASGLAASELAAIFIGSGQWLNAIASALIALEFYLSSAVTALLGQEIAKPTSGKMVVETPSDSKRECGIATAFRVIPIPQAACLQGYFMKCSNERINNYISGSTDFNEKILEYCKNEEPVDFRTERMKVGLCEKITSSITTKNIVSREPQRYRQSDERYPNNLVNAVGEWSDLENVYKANCGVCVNRTTLYSYNGINYSIGELPQLPKSIRTDEHCINYVDDEGRTHAWSTNIKVLTPFDKYTYINRNEILNAIKNILSNKISACNSGTGYTMPVEDESLLNNIKIAFLKMQIRNLEACVTNMMAVYHTGIAMSNAPDECKDEVSSDLENMARAACNDILAIIKGIDGDEYYSYNFVQNTTSANCKDDKYVRETSTKGNNFGSITRIDAEDVLSQYGYGELTVDESSNTDNIVNLTLHVPTSLNGNKEFKTAKLGFYLAGVDNENPLALYKDFRIDNEDDLRRGYSITIGNGLQATKGKYLYYYIQPLNDQGKPNPSYNPNTLFSPSTTDHTAETIASSSLVYSFKDYDINDTGNISVISPRTGKLWVTILDSEELSLGHKDADGQYIAFADDNKNGSTEVNESNVLYTNSGYYTVQANVQLDSEDDLDDIVAGDKHGGLNEIITTLVINNIKKIFIGDYVCKRCSIKNSSLCEKQPDDVDEQVWYTSDYKKVCDYEWDAGILGQVATSFLKMHLLYLAWFLFVVFSVFIIGFQFISGEQKFDFKFMKKYLWRYALIMAFVNPQSLDLYIKLFVRPAFNLAEGLSAFVAGSFSSEKYTALDPQNFTYSAFGPVDKILKFWINKYTLEKLLAILFSSWTGIVVVIILLMCFIFFMISVIEAVVLYIIILMKMTLYLAIGPVVFLLLIHEKTAGKFTEWWKAIAGCIAEQVMMFAGLSCFSTIYYYILKGSMNFVYCWEPVLKIPILDITLFSMWRISGTMPAHMAELAGTLGDDNSVNTKGFNFLTAFMLFIITCMMSKFVDKASVFGAKIFGQQSSMPGEIKQLLGQVKNTIKGLPMMGGKMLKDKISKLGESKDEDKNKEKRSGAQEQK